MQDTTLPAPDSAGDAGPDDEFIVGSRPADHFTMMSNRRARDPGLSLAEKGLLIYLLSHQVGYALTLRQIIGENLDGERAIRTALNALEAKGFIGRSRQRDPATGRLGRYRWRIDAEPPQAAGGQPHCGAQSGPDLHVRRVPAGQDQTALSSLDSAVPRKPVVEDQKKIPPGGVNAAPPSPDEQQTDTPDPDASPSAKAVVAAWVLDCGTRPPGALIGHVGRLVADMLAEGIDPDHIRTALADMSARTLHPSSLPSLVWAAQQATLPIPAQEPERPRLGCGGCEAGWVGEDGEGRPIPCPSCRARTIAELDLRRW